MHAKPEVSLPPPRRWLVQRKKMTVGETDAVEATREREGSIIYYNILFEDNYEGNDEAGSVSLRERNLVNNDEASGSGPVNPYQLHRHNFYRVDTDTLIRLI